MKSLICKTGKVKSLTKAESCKLMFKADGEPENKADLIIKFKTDREGIALAKKFKNLIINPNIELNVKFEKIK